MKSTRAIGLTAVTLLLLAGALHAKPAKAVFAGGCFWCMEGPFEKLPGVSGVISGYSGGARPNPTYEEVGSGGTGHAESVEVIYDPARVSYEKLLEVFWHNIDPLSANGQFCDRGEQYRSIVFYGNENERRLAEESKKKVEQRLNAKVVTEIVPAAAFYRAEEYHQDYSKKNPLRYGFYRKSCGRDARLAELWGADAPHAKEK
ncbi:MAG: peptide-methionine (S)-S-oxide reductase MsrA [Thermoanaerobaculia bacterium]